MRVVKFLLVFLFGVAIVSCEEKQEVKVYSSSYTFSDSASGWTGGFANYATDSAGYHLKFALETLPTDTSKSSLKLSGISLNDSLFMFLKKKVTGLGKNKDYEVLLNVRFASNVPTGKLGEPAETVFVKVGGSTEEPVVEVANNQYQLNIDKGYLAESGTNMVVVGNVGVASTTTKYALISRSNNSKNSVIVTSNAQGELWLIVGTDSGYTGKTELYYTQVDVLFNQLD